MTLPLKKRGGLEKQFCASPVTGSLSLWSGRKIVKIGEIDRFCGGNSQHAAFLGTPTRCCRRVCVSYKTSWMGGSDWQTARLRANGTRPHPHRTHTLLLSLSRAFTFVAGTKSALVNKFLFPIKSADRAEGLAAVCLRHPFDNRLPFKTLHSRWAAPRAAAVPRH